MGQAWCKEKSTKAQDSKSPLDRVFLRCAHRIYPGLKEEGSVLGGATQRVTSSEIGYASSPPREVLTRGQSIDSVDRPFHPNDWVDVNLEVPGTPRGSSVMTNLTLDTTLYPPTTLTSTNSSGSNLRDFTPVPPPRRRKKNRGRPLPPKPDELVSRSHVDRVTTRNSSNKETSRSSSHEPLYSSVKSHKTKSGEKDVFEHKVNGTGRVIPSIVLAANRSNREKSSRSADDRKISRPKNSSTVSLPNYSELEASTDVSLGEDDGVLKVHKITAAESLPSLIARGSAKKAEGVEGDDKIVEADRGKIDKVDKIEQEPSVDEVDFSFDATKSEDALDYVAKLGVLPRLTSTPVKNGFGDDTSTPTTGGGWFLHQDRSPKSNEPEATSTNDSTEKCESSEIQFHDCTKTSRSDVFLESEEDQLEESKDSAERAVEAETEKPRTRTTRPSLKRTLSNESEPFDSYEEKELRGETESRVAVLRSNSQVKLLDRSISEESLPREMLLDQPEDTDFFDDDDKRRPTATMASATSEANENKKEEPIAESVKSDTKTPPPSPEPKIKPEIFDNDHSTLLKVLRDEAEESNLSSMTPSLTELEAALSDMLEREVDQEKPEAEEAVRNVTPAIAESTEVVEKSLEKPIEPRIDVEKNMKKSVLPVSLKNILGDVEKSSRYPEKVEENIKDDSMVEIDLTNGGKCIPPAQHELVEIALNNSSRATTTTQAALEPPEKPSRLHQISANESSENLGKQPTPPRRRNRSSASGHSTTVLRENVRRSSERTATPENPYPNDRLI